MALLVLFIPAAYIAISIFALFGIVPIYFIRCIIYKFIIKAKYRKMAIFVSSLAVMHVVLLFGSRGYRVGNDENYKKNYSEEEVVNGEKIYKNLDASKRAKYKFFNYFPKNISIDENTLISADSKIVPYLIYLQGEREYFLVYITKEVSFFTVDYPNKYYIERVLARRKVLSEKK